MPFLGYEQIEATAVVQTSSVLTVPQGTTHAELQASGQNVRYIMDGAQNPSVGVGMLLLTTDGPKNFEIGDIHNIRFVRGAGTNGYLNIHYYGGRSV